MMMSRLLHVLQQHQRLQPLQTATTGADGRAEGDPEKHTAGAHDAVAYTIYKTFFCIRNIDIYIRVCIYIYYIIYIFFIYIYILYIIYIHVCVCMCVCMCVCESVRTSIFIYQHVQFEARTEKVYKSVCHLYTA